MTERIVDAVVVGGGSAGLAAAAEIARRGYQVAVVERELSLGGILNQCIHNGFGLHYFKEELTGPEYAQRFIELTREEDGIEFHLDTAVLEAEENADHKIVYAISKHHGVTKFICNAIVLAMGCRERNRGNIGIPGTRPSGIFTAGLAQRLVNIDGYIPGREVVIVGSGDIGLIMARRMSWIGAKVHAVVEIQPYPSGLTRNIAQCLNDFDIPLYLSHVVSEIHGKDRVEAVSITPIEDHHPDPAKTFRIPCDTLLLSVGLVPDNEVANKLGVEINPETNGAYVDARLMTNRPGVFVCGNVLHVHDLVDFVTEESTRCGGFVSDYLAGGGRDEAQYRVSPGANVKYVLPNFYAPGRENIFYLRPMIVKNRAELLVTLDGEQIMKKRFPHVQPSEMMSFRLGPANLRGVRPELANVVEVSVG